MEHDWVNMGGWTGQLAGFAGVYLWLGLASVLAGVTTVLFGFGGGFVVVPLLYQMVRTAQGQGSAGGQAAMQVAIATSTCLMVVSSALATRRHARLGNLVRSAWWPMAGYIALGAALGALLVTQVQGQWLRWAFMFYLSVTIADGLLRSGFVAASGPVRRPPGPGKLAVVGTLIGAVAALLGVGGSVMTVPMLRRQGWSMTQATAMASPLTLPVGVAGAISYLLLARPEAVLLPPWYMGYVDGLALLVLVAGSILGMHLAGPWIGRIRDRLHAQIYLALLCLVLLGMWL